MKISMAVLLTGCAVGAASPPDFPIVPEDLNVSLYARDPLVRNPCGMAFDRFGRLCVGMGPQYRSPKPDTPGDTVYILIDEDGDGVADSRKAFATGFNSIQGLAWKEGELWIANAPDLTVVRDLDGDDVADEYVRLYTDLGNLEHGLHGLNWGPDGWFYMSKGNSKGLTQPPDRVAPKPFLDLWGVTPPPGTPAFPKPRVFNAANYQKHYHDPSDDWGRTGGILRCRKGGEGLEIYSRGFRNPWDIAFDSGFHFLGTDNDQNLGDKIFRPFLGADFGWGHSWSYDWKGDTHLPTVPPSGPLFEGSGTGVIYVGLPQYPPRYRNIWLINDWLRREVYIYRPQWEGANMVAGNAPMERFAHAGGGRSMGQSQGRRFSPVDLEIGPDGAIYFGSWGRVYGARYDEGAMANEGRIYRIWPKGVEAIHRPDAFRQKPIATWPVQRLIADLASHLPVWRANAQEELLRRGGKSVAPLRNVLKEATVPESLETWAVWTLGRMPDALMPSSRFRNWAAAAPSLNRRLQSIRVLGWRGEASERFDALLADPEPRIRFEAALAVRVGGGTARVDDLTRLLEHETDRLVYYAAWGALGDLLPPAKRKALLQHASAGVRRGALLSLLEEDELTRPEIDRIANDADPSTAALARRWLGGKSQAVIKGPALQAASRHPEKAVTRPQLGIVSRIESSGGRSEAAMLHVGERAYTDRGYVITQVPEGFEGDLFVRTANNDAEAETGYQLALDLAYDATVFLAHDTRGAGLPTWARDDFEPTDDFLATTDSRHRLFKREVRAGSITLGPNRAGLDDRMSHYVVIVQPKLLKPRARPTTVESALKLRGDPGRGRDLYFSRRGGNCVNCHQLEEYGNVFAPDLSDIGSRATAEFIARSILEPSAEITEGFALRVIETRDGDSVSGFVVEETAAYVKVADLLGQVVQVPARTITRRISANMSAMPATFATTLEPQQVADLTAFLLAQKAAPPAQPAAVKADAPEYAFERDGNQLHFLFRGTRIATYLIDHPDLKRRAFVNIQSPSGIPVSRAFPAPEGSDHRVMHPGICIAFGHLDGNDYWRKKAEVQHEGFVVEPRVEDGRAVFAVRNRYLSEDGRQTACLETARYSFEASPEGIRLSIDHQFSNPDRDFYFGDQEESGLCIRVAPEIRVDGGNGRIINNHGHVNGKETWGKEFDWIQYGGQKKGKHVGFVIVPHSGNPRPTWAHSRDYGVLVANPFPKQPRERREPYVKTWVKKGESYRLRYTVLIYETDQPLKRIPGQ